MYGGEGLARLDGQVVLAPFVLPGESASIEVEGGSGDLLRARRADILTPSADRVEPACPYFYRCGGCHYQHARYELQVEQKREILREQLRRVGKIDFPGEIETVSAEPFGYRNRSQFHLAHGEIGYRAAASHALVSVTECPISSPQINQALAALRAMMADRRFPHFIRSIELFSNEAEVQVNVLETERPVARFFFNWCAEHIPGASAGSLDYAVAGETFCVSHRSFFQVNRFLVDALVEQALGEAAGESALDLYAGVGLFSLKLARRFSQVTAIESGASAVRDLEFNAQRAGLGVSVQRARVEQALAGLTTTPDFVLADPPRAGLGKQAVRELLRLRAPRLAIVACDPATLARDLAALTAGGYAIEKLTMVDLFPQTYHIEAIAHLR